MHLNSKRLSSNKSEVELKIYCLLSNRIEMLHSVTHDPEKADLIEKNI